MPLRITKNQEVYQIEGSIVKENSRSLKHHFEKLFLHTEKIILSVDKVKKIDVLGIKTLTELYENAMKNNKIFMVIGIENKNINNAFENVGYMFRRDVL